MPSTALLGQIQAINSVLGSYRIHDVNFQLRSHSYIIIREDITKLLEEAHNSNRWLNYYLECVDHPKRVDLPHTFTIDAYITSGQSHLNFGMPMVSGFYKN